MIMYNTFKEILDEVKQSDCYFDISTMTWAEAKTKSTAEIRFFARLGETEPEHLKQMYRDYKATLQDMVFKGKLFEVRPYSSLSEAVMDGIIGHNAAGMETVYLTADSDEVVLCVRATSSPDKTLGYVKYTRAGELITIRSLCNIEIENANVRNFLKKFGKQIVARLQKEKEDLKEFKAM